MLAKIKNFLSNFFRNAVTDPVGTGKGLIQISGGAATVYGMATGKVPVNELSIGAASAMTAAGLHAIGSDSTAAAVLTGNARVQQVFYHYEAIHAELAAAQAVIEAVNSGKLQEKKP